MWYNSYVRANSSALKYNNAISKTLSTTTKLSFCSSVTQLPTLGYNNTEVSAKEELQVNSYIRTNSSAFKNYFCSISKTQQPSCHFVHPLHNFRYWATVMLVISPLLLYSARMFLTCYTDSATELRVNFYARTNSSQELLPQHFENTKVQQPSCHFVHPLHNFRYWATVFKCHEEVLYLQPLIPPKLFDIFFS